MTQLPMSPNQRGGFFGRPNEPFFFGRGGRRLSTQDISTQRQLGLRDLAEAGDTSPVGHWTQGLARALGGITGNIRLGRAEAAETAAADEKTAQQQAIIRGLLPDSAEGVPDPIAAALLNPELRDVGMSILEARQPKAPALTDFGKLLAEMEALPPGDPRRAQYQSVIDSKSDPWVTITLPGGGIFNGPQSELGSVLSGGGAGNPPARPVGALRPLGPNIENTPSPEMGGGGMPESLNRAQYQAVVERMGKEATDAWIARNNIPVRD